MEDKLKDAMHSSCLEILKTLHDSLKDFLENSEDFDYFLSRDQAVVLKMLLNAILEKDLT